MDCVGAATASVGCVTTATRLVSGAYLLLPSHPSLTFALTLALALALSLAFVLALSLALALALSLALVLALSLSRI